MKVESMKSRSGITMAFLRIALMAQIVLKEAEGDESCYGVTELKLLQTQRVHVTSPNYPVEYPANAVECWSIHLEAIDGSKPRIKLEVNDFNVEDDVERCSTRRRCKHRCDEDKVIVYDGDSQDGCKFGTYCGIEMDSPIISRGEDMFITFTSDKGSQRSGFNFTLTATDESGSKARCPDSLSRAGNIAISTLLILYFISALCTCAVVSFFVYEDDRKNKKALSSPGATQAPAGYPATQSPATVYPGPPPGSRYGAVHFTVHGRAVPHDQTQVRQDTTDTENIV